MLQVLSSCCFALLYNLSGLLQSFSNNSRTPATNPLERIGPKRCSTSNPHGQVQKICLHHSLYCCHIGGFHVTSSPPCWWTVNKRSLISLFCLSTSICSFHHCYLCLPRLHENHLFIIFFSPMAIFSSVLMPVLIYKKEVVPLYNA